MRACSARTPCGVGCCRSIRYERVLNQRDTSLCRRMTVVRRASCDLLFFKAGFRVARAGKPLCSLSFGRERAMRVCSARAPCRVSRSRYIRRERALNERETSLRRCKTVV